MVINTKKTMVTLVSSGVLVSGMFGAMLTSAPAFAKTRLKGTFTVGVGDPLTGDQANYGILVYDSKKIAANYVNSHGGVLGQKMVLLPWDTKADPATGVAGAHYFVSQNVNAVSGFFDSDVTIPSIRILSAANIPLFGGNPSTPSLVSMHLNNFTRITGDDALEGMIQAQYAIKNLHAKTAFVLNDEETFGEAFAQAFAGEFKKLGGKVVSYQGIDPSSNDYSAILANVKAAKPDILQFSGFYQPAALLVKQARQLGIKSTFLTDSSVYGPQFLSLAGSAAVGTYMTNLPVSMAKSSLGNYLATNLQKQYHLKVDPIAANAFDSIIQVWKAAQLAHSTKPADLLRVMKKVKFVGATGVVSFLPDGDRAQVDYTVLKVMPGLKYNTVYQIKETLK